MTERTERALIRFLLMWFRISHFVDVDTEHQQPSEYFELLNEVK